jgi:hypothetical protein
MSFFLSVQSKLEIYQRVQLFRHGTKNDFLAFFHKKVLKYETWSKFKIQQLKINQRIELSQFDLKTNHNFLSCKKNAKNQFLPFSIQTQS